MRCDQRGVACIQCYIAPIIDISVSHAAGNKAQSYMTVTESEIEGENSESSSSRHPLTSGNSYNESDQAEKETENLLALQLRAPRAHGPRRGEQHLDGPPAAVALPGDLAPGEPPAPGAPARPLQRPPAHHEDRGDGPRPAEADSQRGQIHCEVKLLAQAS